MEGKGVKIAVAIIFTIAIPYIITSLMSGNAYRTSKKMNNVSSGRDIIVQIDNKNKIIDVEQYIVGIIAAEIINSDEGINNNLSDEILKAKAVMLRTEIYYVMGERTIAEKTEFKYEYYDYDKLKEKWGKYEYEENIIKIENAVLTTLGQTE